MRRKIIAIGRRRLLAMALWVSITGCSPALDWREVRGSDAPYSVLMPAKPAAHSRVIDLDGIKTSMTMQGAEVNGVTYAVGHAALNNPELVPRLLMAMQTGLVKNIRGKVVAQKTIVRDGMPMLVVEATGSAPSGQPLHLHARFAGRGVRVYQALVIGPENKVGREAADTFLDSFRPN